jgi:glycosyltransferase involved in cell wall biosynthesis
MMQRPSEHKIVFINHSGAIGGAERSLVDLVRMFQARSRACLFEDGPLSTLLEETGVAVEVLPVGERLMRLRRQGAGGGISAVFALIRAVLALGRSVSEDEVLYANTQKAFMVAAVLSAVTRNRVVLHLNDLIIPEHFGWIQRRTTILLANLFASGVVANSRACADAFEAEGGRRDIVRIAYYPFRAADWPVQSGTPLNEGPTVGSFSRIAEWKGQHVIIEAMKWLPRAHLMIVGAALFADDTDYERRIREMASMSPAANRIHFVGFLDDIRSTMARCDVVVHSSTDPEPFGRVIAEALLLEVPVVATRAGGVEDIVREDTGYLVTPGDPEELAAVLREILENRSRSRKMAQHGRQVILSKFGEEQMRLAVESVCSRY